MNKKQIIAIVVSLFVMWAGVILAFSIGEISIIEVAKVSGGVLLFFVGFIAVFVAWFGE